MYFIIYRAYDELGNLHGSSSRHLLGMLHYSIHSSSPHCPLPLEQAHADCTNTITVQPNMNLQSQMDDHCHTIFRAAP